jgi:hypothetical protein
MAASHTVAGSDIGDGDHEERHARRQHQRVEHLNLLATPSAALGGLMQRLEQSRIARSHKSSVARKESRAKSAAPYKDCIKDRLDRRVLFGRAGTEGDDGSLGVARRRGPSIADD